MVAQISLNWLINQEDLVIFAENLADLPLRTRIRNGGDLKNPGQHRPGAVCRGRPRAYASATDKGRTRRSAPTKDKLSV